jgi:hypothetical protein
MTADLKSYPAYKDSGVPCLARREDAIIDGLKKRKPLAFKVGGIWRFRKDQFERWIESKTTSIRRGKTQRVTHG